MDDPIQCVISPHSQDLGGWQARRLLPSALQTMVGPFIFFDHLGPAEFQPHQGMDVRPHPHINLATVTYLFEGVILHRDSLGTVQEIHPGAVNWMTAGRGIVHSERTPAQIRQQAARLHGIQTWVALPTEQEETEPAFYHYPATEIPGWQETGASVRVIAGSASGYDSPVPTFSPMLYLDVQLEPAAHFTLAADYSERAVYGVSTGIQIEGQDLPQHHLAILTPGHPVQITASTAGRCLIIGGEPVGERWKWWNFVSSRPDRIEQAKRDWREQRFDPVPEEVEFIPLPPD